MWTFFSSLDKKFEKSLETVNSSYFIITFVAEPFFVFSVALMES